MKNNLDRKVILEEHNPIWLKQFQEEKVKIENILSEYNICVEHVGSSSVSHLFSKPIIDIAIAIENFDFSKKIIDLLEIHLNYHYDPILEKKLPMRRHLWKGNQDVHNFHIWIVEFNSNDWKDMIYVREYLKTNEKARKEYSNFKKELIKNNINTRTNYRIKKSKIYKKILREAWVNMDE